jgi:hypothetical protein
MACRTPSAARGEGDPEPPEVTGRPAIWEHSRKTTCMSSTFVPMSTLVMEASAEADEKAPVGTQQMLGLVAKGRSQFREVDRDDAAKP